MKVVEYIKQNGLQALIDNFKINVRQYDDRVVLNYDQIESPRFDPICDECRALILQKGTWKVLARSFDRFYNLCEGVELQKFPMAEDGSYVYQKRAGGEVRQFKILNSYIFGKLDGSLITYYHDGNKWNFSTRSMAFAEGSNALGVSFHYLSVSTPHYPRIAEYLEQHKELEHLCFAFELTAPENRIVTPYKERALTLLGVRDMNTQLEWHFSEVEKLAEKMRIPSAPVYNFKTIEESNFNKLCEFVESLPAMDEGCVLCIYNEDGEGKPWRLKLKNSKYLAIANMRENGVLSPKNVLHLVMKNEQAEYLLHFCEDRKFFDLVEKEYNALIDNINGTYAKVKDIENQKEYALAVMKNVQNPIEKGFLFSMRKGQSLVKMLSEYDPRKIVEALGLKEKFVKEFNIDYEAVGKN